VSDFGIVAEKLRRSTVRVDGSGSGVIWKPGIIVTNAHVARKHRMKIELWSGDVIDAVVEKRDSQRDLALLRASSDAPPAQPGDSDVLRPGQIVLAVGNPLGFVGALSTGVIHGQGSVRGLGRQSWVLADVRLAPGNSGGPLADAEGRVVGINTMIAGRLALAVPGNAVAVFLNSAHDSVRLGVTLREIPGAGLLILEVAPDSPAARASLLAGDILVDLAPDELSDSIARRAVLPLKFRRGGHPAIREVAVRLRNIEAAA
jgi:serine protease Do